MTRSRTTLFLSLLFAIGSGQLLAGELQPVSAQDHASPPDSDSAARRAFEAGRDAYDQGSFDAALLHFEEAYALHPSPELLYNVGRAADSDGQPSRAITAYSSYLETYPGAPNRDFVRARLVKMQALERDRAAANAPAAAEPRALPTVAQAEQNAEASTLVLRATSSPAHDDDVPKRSRWTRALIWTAVGVLVAGGVVAGVVLATRDRAPDRAMADDYVVTPETR